MVPETDSARLAGVLRASSRVQSTLSKQSQRFLLQEQGLCFSLHIQELGAPSPRGVGWVAEALAVAQLGRFLQRWCRERPCKDQVLSSHWSPHCPAS